MKLVASIVVYPRVSPSGVAPAVDSPILAGR